MTLTHNRISPILRLFAAALVAVALASCSGDDGVDGPVEISLWDIVTYEGPDGSSGSRFTFRQVNDSPLITLTSTATLSDLDEGTRLAIRYIPSSGNAYESGPVRLLQASKITQSEVAMEWNDDFDNWGRDKVYVYSLWRSGNYINAHVKLTYTSEPRIFRLAADPATIESDWPVVYLVHILPGEIDNHDRTYLASFDISPLWLRPDVKGVILKVANSNLNKDIFTFAKAN